MVEEELSEAARNILDKLHIRKGYKTICILTCAKCIVNVHAKYSTFPVNVHSTCMILLYKVVELII